MLTLEDFERYSWQELIDEAEGHDCTVYSRLFHTRGRELAEAGDDRGRSVFDLLSDCTSPWLDSESKVEPLRPIFESATSRTPIPADLPETEVMLLPELASITRDPELRARLVDIAWLRRRDHRMAQLAIESYIESAKRLDTEEHWPDAKDRVERALRLAAQLGKAGKEKLDAIVEYIESVIAKEDSNQERRFQPLRLMDLLIEFHAGNANRWSARSKSLAEKAEAEGDWDRAEAYWETKSAWDRLRDDDQARQTARVRAAETRVKLARELLQNDPPDHLLASIHLQKAVEGMRQAGEPMLAEGLHRELLQNQELALGQLQEFSAEVDISSYVTAAKDAVRGQSLEMALIILVRQQPSSVASLRQYAERLGRDYVFANLFPTVHLDHQGRVSAVKPSRHSSDPAEVEAAIRADMFEHARQLQEGYAVMFIEPAREQIVLDHHATQRDLRPIVSNNPLIGVGRAELVLRGLYAGLVGDFVVACHLLVPQIEHSIRHVLNQQGIVTTSLSSERIQEEQDLSRLLQRPETIEIWGEDLIFYLRGLLVERFGANLRNRLAHGMMHELEFDSWQGSYLWWIALRFYMLPILMRIPAGNDLDAEEPNRGESSDDASQITA
jgi:hypothetical protein